MSIDMLEYCVEVLIPIDNDFEPYQRTPEVTVC
jgi:hypothetical protein